MRLKQYLSVSNINDDLNEFRFLKVMLVNKLTHHKEKVEKIIKENNLNIDIIKMIENSNKYLKKSQRKNIFFDFAINDDNIEVNKKMNSRLKMKCLEFNDELSKIQRKLEQKIKNGDFK